MDPALNTNQSFVFSVEKLDNDFDNVYKSIKKDEIEAKDILISFEEDYPKVAKESNINDILKSLKGKRGGK